MEYNKEQVNKFIAKKVTRKLISSATIIAGLIILDKIL